ncbi:6,7-dimethyl-8-ribityllumazine synthase [Pseudooceanicola antarcticus]|uniref:6,7-dimethyl-8-ribityllumazine synthase n=1 Tax=Pseudooceanicola antarcticus TaxID=1247613 RepID=A0A285JAU1_9RHOB|nr:6,7-dimethyl-8-ribityllumazine synthase [Pseudooceanicola antarcticus]PJE30783.1 6,7-dimethyl-8-ribityllumazine synthase [Pseudooceanicola antarcticus]SNY56987.1 6,7-dimethyl-8-ribityllumazine synthase [Pseudooceanicola antarcticus]
MAGSEQHYTLPRGSVSKPTKVLIVVAPYYKDIADELIAGATAEIEAWGATPEVIEVPGALEIPTAIAMAGRMSDYDAYVALGCVIRGETTHYDTVCNDSSRGITLLGLQGFSIGNGILTVENRDQALARARVAEQNKGGGAAAAALHLLALSRKWGASKSGVGFLPVADEASLTGKA